MKISAVLIVKNEAPCIERCLESIKNFDEIVIVDTGSTDGTQDICIRYTDKVYEDYKWNDDFAEARNYANSKATGDWLYSIDADHVNLSTIEEFRSEVAKAEEGGHIVCFVNSIHETSRMEHWRELLWKNGQGVRWVGPVHECLNPPATYRTNLARVYGYSKNHASDPMRNIRILKKRCDVSLPRTQFYLGREYYEKGLFLDSINWLDKYLEKAWWIPEKCEALITKARCLWKLNRGNEAREVMLECIRNNPDFKEALLFMGELHYEPWRSRWNRLAEACTNEDVLFIRNR